MATILVTGTSSGIGMAIALDLGRAGHTVYATMRNPGRSPMLGEQAKAESLPISILTMDVDSDESVAGCFAQMHEQAKPIDVLVNNAGLDKHGAIEELPMEAFRATMETNYFGAIRCMQQVLPHMRKRGSGCIINVTSVAGRIAVSPFGPYAASKFALEALSEALAQEMMPFGVRVAIVEPGTIDTPMSRATSVDPPPSIYRQGRHIAALFRASLAQPLPASQVATVVRHVIESDDRTLRHPAGPDAAPFLSWRASMTDEDWIEFNALGTTEFKKRAKKDFGLDLDIPDES